MNYKRRPPLGRGLSSLFDSDSDIKIDERSLNIRQNDILDKFIEISLIKCGKYQPRKEFSDQQLDELTSSIKKDGVISPLIVRKCEGHYELIAGERRLRASLAVGLKVVPARVIKADEQYAKRIALIDNIQRSDLTPLEEAEAYEMLIKEHKCTQSYLADLVSKSRSHIANSLRLINLPDFVKSSLSSKALSMGHARAILCSENAESLAKHVLEKNLNVRETEDLVRSEKRTKHKVRKNASDKKSIVVEKEDHEEVGEICEIISLSIKMGVEIKEGKLTIKFNNMKNLDFLVKKLAN